MSAPLLLALGLALAALALALALPDPDPDPLGFTPPDDLIPPPRDNR